MTWAGLYAAPAAKGGSHSGPIPDHLPPPSLAEDLRGEDQKLEAAPSSLVPPRGGEREEAGVQAWGTSSRRVESPTKPSSKLCCFLGVGVRDSNVTASVTSWGAIRLCGLFAGYILMRPLLPSRDLPLYREAITPPPTHTHHFRSGCGPQASRCPDAGPGREAGGGRGEGKRWTHPHVQMGTPGPEGQ